MKELKFYVCEICGQRYSAPNQADACECGHKKVKGFSNPKYNADDRKNEYPDSVEILFTDGTSARYYRYGR